MDDTPVATKDEFIDVIYELIDAFDSDDGPWENRDICTFLGAMAGWLNDAAGYYRNTGKNVDAATAIMAAICRCPNRSDRL